MFVKVLYIIACNTKRLNNSSTLSMYGTNGILNIYLSPATCMITTSVQREWKIINSLVFEILINISFSFDQSFALLSSTSMIKSVSSGTTWVVSFAISDIANDTIHVVPLDTDLIIEVEFNKAKDWSKENEMFINISN